MYLQAQIHIPNLVCLPNSRTVFFQKPGAERLSVGMNMLSFSVVHALIHETTGPWRSCSLPVIGIGLHCNDDSVVFVLPHSLRTPLVSNKLRSYHPLAPQPSEAIRYLNVIGAAFGRTIPDIVSFGIHNNSEFHQPQNLPSLPVLSTFTITSTHHTMCQQHTTPFSPW